MLDISIFLKTKMYVMITIIVQMFLLVCEGWTVILVSFTETSKPAGVYCVNFPPG